MGKSLLVLSTEKSLSVERLESMDKLLRPVAKRLGFELVIAGDGVSVSVHHDLAPLVDAINQQTRSVCELVESNRALIAVMAEDCDQFSEDNGSAQYLDDVID